MSEITQKLRDWSNERDEVATDSFVSLVYEELRRQAHNYLSRERAGHTLQTTALVHEAYLKLIKQKNISWESRTHFFAVASTLMRRILIDYAKTRHRVKRGGLKDAIPLDENLTIAVSEIDCDLLALDEALTRLAQKDEYLARVVELRFFSGLDVVETAKILGVSDSTVKRDWQMAKAWIYRELTK